MISKSTKLYNRILTTRISSLAHKERIQTESKLVIYFYSMCHMPQIVTWSACCWPFDVSLSQPSRTPLLAALIYFQRDQKGMSPLCFKFSLTLPPRGTKRGTHSLGGTEVASEYMHSHKHDLQTALCAAHTSPWPHLSLTSASAPASVLAQRAVGICHRQEACHFPDLHQ